MHYSIIQVPEFYVMGIEIRTDNNHFLQQVPPFRQRFYAENIQQQIPHKIDNELLAVYSQYAGDYTQPFSYMLGCRVSSIDTVPAGMVAHTVPAQRYAVYTVTGEFPQSAAAAWHAIWSSTYTRAYTIDFEVYGERFSAPEKEVKIFICLN